MSRPKRKIVSLAERRLEPVPEVIAALEHLLDRAKRGEVRGIAVGLATDNHGTGGGFTLGDCTIADLYLGIERTKIRLLDHRE